MTQQLLDVAQLVVRAPADRELEKETLGRGWVQRCGRGRPRFGVGNGITNGSWGKLAGAIRGASNRSWGKFAGRNFNSRRNLNFGRLKVKERRLSGWSGKNPRNGQNRESAQGGVSGGSRLG